MSYTSQTFAKPRIDPTITDENDVYIFNPNDFITGKEEVTSASLSATLQNFVSEYGGSVMVGDFVVGPASRILFQSTGETQSIPFTTELNSSVVAALSNTSAVTYDSATGTQLSGDVTVTGRLNLPNSTIGTSNIADGSITDAEFLTLDGINLGATIQQQLNGKHPTINSSNRLNVSNIANGSVSNTQLQMLNDLVTDYTVETRFNSITSDISSANTNIAANTVDIGIANTNIAANTVDIGTANTNISNLTTLTSTHTSQIESLTSTDTSLGNAINSLSTVVDTKANYLVKVLPIELTLTNVDYDNNTLTTSIANNTVTDSLETNDMIINNSLAIDGTCTISNNTYTITDQQFGYLSTIDGNVKDNLVSLQNQITDNDNDISTINTAISAHSTTLSSHTTSLGNHTTSLSNHATTLSNHGTRIGSLETTTQGHTTSIEDLENDIIALQNADITINTTLGGKQNAINASNRLNASFISDGSIGNNQFQTLLGINTTKTIQTQFDEINTTIIALDGLQDLDVTNIPLIQSTLLDHTTSISNLNTTMSTKQNTIDTSHKLASSLISTNVNSTASVLTTVLQGLTDNVASIETTLTGKQNVINGTNKLNATYVASTYGVQNMNVDDALTDLRAGIDYNTGSITNLNNSKQNLLGAGNKLSYQFIETTVDQTLQDYVDQNDLDISGLQTTLSLHDSRISSTETTLTGKQNTINGSNKLNASYVMSTYGLTPLNVNDAIADLKSGIDYNTGSITSVNNAKQNVIDANHKVSYQFIETTAGQTLNDYITQNDTDISAIESTLSGKQNTINSENKLASTNVSTYVNSTTSTLSTILQSLTDINTNQSTSLTELADDITDILNTAAGLSTSISTNSTNIGSLQAADVIHDGQISTIASDVSALDTRIDTLETFQTSQGTTNTTILTAIDDIQSDILTIDTSLGTKQDKIDSTHKLAINNVDLSGSNLRFIDISSNLQAQLTSITGQIATLTTLQSGDVTNFEAIDANFTTINTALDTKQANINSSNRLNANLIGTGEVSNTKLNYLKNVTSDIQAQIDAVGGGGGGGSSVPSISYDSGTTTTTITDTTILDTLKFGDSTTQSTAFTSSKSTDISNNKNKLTDVTFTSGTTTIANTLVANGLTSTVIDTINNTLSTLDSTKQNVISASAKLDGSYLNAGSGTMSNLKLQYLSSVASDLATSLSAINSAITALQSYDTAQTTLNTGYASDISSLYSGKQNLLSDTNLLNPSFINAGTGVLNSTKMQYLSSIDADIASKFSAKQNTITDDSLTIARTSGLQTALNGKQAVLANASFLDATSSVQNQLNAKLSLSGGTVSGNLTASTNILCNNFKDTSGYDRLTMSGGNIQINGNQGGQGITQILKVLPDATYTATAGDCYTTLIMNCGAARIINLPDPAGLASGAWIIICNLNTSNAAFTLDVKNGAVIQARLTPVTANMQAGQSVRLICDTTRWYRA